MVPLVASTAYLASRSARGLLAEELVERLSAAATGYATHLSLQGDNRRLTRLDEGATLTRTRLQAQVREHRDAVGLRRLRVLSLDSLVIVDDTDELGPFSRDFELEVDRLEIRAAIEAGEPRTSVLFTAPDGLKYQRAYAPVFVEDSVAALVLAEGSSEAFHRLSAAERRFGLLVLSAMLASLLAAWLVARRLTMPLRELQSAASRIGDGDLKQPVPEGGPLEVMMLARQLEVMRVALDEREQGMRMMLSGVAHEIRNPLAAIQLQLDILEHDLSQLGDQPASVESLRREFVRLNSVVTTFLAWSRDRKPQLSERALDSLVNNAVIAAAADALTKEVEVVVEASPVRVVCDAAELESALLNLLLNAIEASPTGATVSVKTEVSDGQVRIAVQDKGSGMDEDTAARATEPFFTTRQQGSGLGLALVQRTMVRHNGRLLIDTLQGEGSSVTLSFPHVRAGEGGGKHEAEPLPDDEIWIH